MQQSASSPFHTWVQSVTGACYSGSMQTWIFEFGTFKRRPRSTFDTEVELDADADGINVEIVGRHDTMGVCIPREIVLKLVEIMNASANGTKNGVD